MYRSYYVETDADSKKILAAYRQHIARMFGLAGQDPSTAAAGADAVIRVENKLAEISRTPVQLRDREANYNKRSQNELAALAPSLHWQRFFDSITDNPKTVPAFSFFIVGQPEYLEGLNRLVESIPIADWREYLRWHLLDHTANCLSEPLETEDFNFYEGVLQGITAEDPRWKRVLFMINGHSGMGANSLGEALGRIWAGEHFPEAAKARATQMVQNLKEAFRSRLETRDWLSPEAKATALQKLSAMKLKIGYPDKWRDYSGLEIRPDSFIQNVFRTYAFELRYKLERFGEPVDRSRWDMTPPSVNCYYSSSRNEMVFPAGVLQPPYFDANAADDAVNYGAMGAQMAHEMTHGFDDQGRKYDAAGNLKDWWTPEDRSRFAAKNARLVQQYSECVVVGDSHINGELTLGENIADLGGLTIAYDAYIKSLGGKPAPILDGFTGSQRFFIGYAYLWCDIYTDAHLRQMLRNNQHSPEEFRVLVPLSNFAPFYDAFNVKPGNKMYRPPEERVEIW